MRLIDADAIPWTNLNDNNPNSEIKVLITFADKVNRMPTIEERKNGKWIDTDTVWTAICGDDSIDIPSKKCSECKKPIAQIMWNNYCPNCGAMMEGVEL